MLFRNLFARGKKNQPRQKRNLLTEPAKIANILNYLQKDKTLLQIELPGTDATYSSAIIKVNKADAAFLLDELIPIDGHKLLLESKKLRVRCQSRGATISFDAVLEKAGRSSDIAFYKLRFPDSMNYIQRRSYFRAITGSAKQITVSVFHDANRGTITGHIIDISPYGACIVFTSSSMMHRGDILKMCRLKLPDGQAVSFTLEVRYTKKLLQGRVRIGGLFKDLSKQSQEHIERLVRILERESLKKKT